MTFFSNIFHWYFSKNSLPYWGIFLIDCFIVFFSSLLVFTANNGVIYTAHHLNALLLTLLLYLCCYIVGFRAFHTYSGVIRYSSFVDLQRVSMSMVFGLTLSIALRQVLYATDTLIFVRMRDIVIWTLIALLFMWMMRVFVKYIYDNVYTQRGAQNVFILGVRNGGVAIAKSIRNQDPAKYKVAGFVTDTPNLGYHMLMGVKIYNFNPNLINEMRKAHATALFVSPLRSESLRNNQEMVTALIDAGIKIFIVPQEQEWDGHSNIQAQMMREVQIEDLLPREKIEVDMDAIGHQLCGKRILITGAAGSIGSEIVRQVAIYDPAELILIDQAETPLHDIRLMMARDFKQIKAYTIVADIAHQRRMADIFSDHKPHYVFHAAAYKHVPMMEDNPIESIQNNVEGTRIVADLAVKHGALKFVMVSTDKAVNPTNIMGCSKRICEIYVQALDKAIKEGKVKGNTQFVTTRFGNVLGSNGSVIPIFKDQIKRGGPITVTHPDIIRYFMLIPEACKLVLEAGIMGHGGEIFVFDMGEPVKIVDLAKRMIKLAGVDVKIKFTGLRDGEKLYEEVLNEKETTLPTVHPKIMVAKVREYDYEQVNTTLDHLVKSSITEDDMTVVRQMKELVPEFKSQHSIYQKIDSELETKYQ